MQNADDATFSDSVTPTWTLSLDGDRGIVVHTNEEGMSASNVTALCNVALSSKKRPATGEKGEIS